MTFKKFDANLKYLFAALINLLFCWIDDFKELKNNLNGLPRFLQNQQTYVHSH